MEQALGIMPPSDEGSGRAGREVLYRFTKRAFDIAFSTAAIVLGSWLYALIVLAIKIDDPSGPVLFKQLRVGKDGRTFRMWKFRSMRVGAEAEVATLMQYNEKDGPVFKMHDDPRVTRVGKFLRAHSLDELPQFFNVLMGQMSVVGPRPGLPSECSSYNYYQAYRLNCKPGIASYWQVQPDRDTISFDEWMRLDVLYLRTCSFLTDLRIIFQTVFAVLRAQGC